MAGAQGTHMTLWCWIHPSTQLPFQFEAKDHPFYVELKDDIGALMDMWEGLFDELCDKNNLSSQAQVSVLWNIKAPKIALNPKDTIESAFQNGDTFGVYAEVVQRRAPVPKIAEKDKMPVTILTGFLGAGKTTLLNYILEEQREKKIAVIENEFGEVSIDDALLNQGKMALAEKVVVMDNGCMCCTIRGDLEKGLQSIMDEVKSGKTKIDAIIIETTGMADPVPIIRTFMANPLLTSQLRLDGLVAVADAKHLPARLDDKVEEGKVNEAFQQIAFADKVLLNKLDLVTPKEAITCKDRIRAVNKFAKVLPSVKGRIKKLSELFDMHAHNMETFAGDIEKEAESELHEHGHDKGHGHDEHEHGKDKGHGHGHGHDDGHGGICTEDHGEGHHGHGGHNHDHDHDHDHDGQPPHKKSRHDSRVNSFAIVKEGEIPPRKLSSWMGKLGTLPDDKGTIYRIKAILAVKGHPYKHVFHAVMDVSDEADVGAWGKDEKKVSKIVFIGKNLDKRFLTQGFEECFLEDE